MNQRRFLAGVLVLGLLLALAGSVGAGFWCGAVLESSNNQQRLE